MIKEDLDNLNRLGFFSSPPQGSPKPMTRNRKNKPAPVPPANPPNRESVVVSEERRPADCEESSHSAAESTQIMLGFERLLAAEKQSEEVNKKTDDTKEPERGQSEPEVVVKPKLEENVTPK